jgi:hypothetical protein
MEVTPQQFVVNGSQIKTFVFRKLVITTHARIFDVGPWCIMGMKERMICNGDWLGDVRIHDSKSKSKCTEDWDGKDVIGFLFSLRRKKRKETEPVASTTTN